jgi:hypothetical protein
MTSAEKESYGYDEMFDDESFTQRFRSARARSRPTRDLQKSLFRKSGFEDPHETMSFEDERAPFMSRRPASASYTDQMPGSVSTARFMTSFENENFYDNTDTGYSNFIARRARSDFSTQPFYANAPGNRGRTWASFNAGD